MRNRIPSLSALFLTVFFAFQPVTGFAHGEGPWNDFMIDNKNAQVEITVERVKKTIADIALARRQVTSWPDPELRNLRISIIVLQEYVDAMLNHLKEEDGIYLQVASALRDNPQAGRSVAGSYALELALELIDYISAMESHEAFANDLTEDGITAYMFDLMDTYLDKMYVYGRLQQTTAHLAALQAAHDSRTVSGDFKYHLRRLFLQLGLNSLANWLVETPVTEPDKADTDTLEYGGALSTEITE